MAHLRRRIRAGAPPICRPGIRNPDSSGPHGRAASPLAPGSPGSPGSPEAAHGPPRPSRPPGTLPIHPGRTLNSPPLDPRRFADRVGSWLLPEGPDADVIVSSRVRLARNLGEFPFVSRLQPEQAIEIGGAMREHLGEMALDGETVWVDMSEVQPVLRLLLRERHLVSRDLAPGGGTQSPPVGRAVAFGRSETVSVMVNEEDHLRLQAMSAGFDLDQAWRKAQDLDRDLEGRISYAYSSDYGYLTGCPTNVGTGMRASVMLHLPALATVRGEIEKVFASAQRTGLAVRGLFGEGSRAAGDFFQISNQVTLGRTEGQLLGELRNLVPAIVRYERSMRTHLLKGQRAALTDKVHRSVGILRTSRSITTDDALRHLSDLRLGHFLGLLHWLKIETLNRMRVQIQRGHVQVLTGRAGEGTEEPLVDPTERDRLRAEYLRNAMAARG